MKHLNLAVVGFGRLGRACATAIIADEQSRLAGVVRQAEHAGEPLPPPFGGIPSVAHISELDAVDAALICVPTDSALGTACDFLESGVPVVECATLHATAFHAHKDALDHAARRYKTSAVVGAGWDPGALSLLRGIFSLLTPKGHTRTTNRPGISLHHSTVAGAVPGVRDALATELDGPNGAHQRYVYVELENDADEEAVATAIRSDPLFLDEETLVFPVASVATLEEEGHGVVVERRGVAAGAAHQLLLLEARFAEPQISAQIMLAAAHALPTRGHRAYSLFDLPLSTLWGDVRRQAEDQWI
jgi:diaminopimelate dehydrogenase